ncbi:hypothetical protein HY408_01815 [Candidatus Gottesmanbacteria bacterium]|nr:hypothetical protein [Candidatus Gottesmanbacteria bacterium]
MNIDNSDAQSSEPTSPEMELSLLLKELKIDHLIKPRDLLPTPLTIIRRRKRLYGWKIEKSSILTSPTPGAREFVLMQYEWYPFTEDPGLQLVRQDEHLENKLVENTPQLRFFHTHGIHKKGTILMISGSDSIVISEIGLRHYAAEALKYLDRCQDALVEGRESIEAHRQKIIDTMRVLKIP